MFGRAKPTRTHSEQMRDELQESYGHLKAAATHVVGGTAEKLTPPYDRASGMASRRWKATKIAFRPFAEQFRTGVANARSVEITVQKKSRWPVLAGLLVIGTAVGAAGALVTRRRRAAQWDQYEPTPAVGVAPVGAAGESARGGMSSATRKVQAGAASLAESVSSQAGRLADTLNEKSGRQGSFGNAERAGRDPSKTEETPEGRPEGMPDDMAARAHSAVHRP